MHKVDVSSGLERALESVTTRLERATHYAYVGVFPNFMASMAVARALEAAAAHNSNKASRMIIAAGLNALVGHAKFREYEEVKDALTRHGWDERIVKPKMYSWCQRHAAHQAAKELGYREQFDAYAKREGHKWYHVVPKVHRFMEIVR